MTAPPARAGPHKGHLTRDQAALKRRRSEQRRGLQERRRALPIREGARGDHRRGQLRLGIRPGRPLLQGREPDQAGPRPDARRPRRLPRPRHRVHRRLRHRRRQGRQGSRAGDLGGPEQHDQVRQGAEAPRRARAPRHDPRRPRQVPQGEDHQGARRDRRHRHASSRRRIPTWSSPTCPVGSEQATKWYVEQVLEAGCGFVNCIPVFIAREDYWDKRFKKARPADRRRRHQVAGRRDDRAPHPGPPVRRPRRGDASAPRS